MSHGPTDLIALEVFMRGKKMPCVYEGESQRRPQGSGARPCCLLARTTHCLKNSSECAPGPRWRRSGVPPGTYEHLDLPIMSWGMSAPPSQRVRWAQQRAIMRWKWSIGIRHEQDQRAQASSPRSLQLWGGKAKTPH